MSVMALMSVRPPLLTPDLALDRDAPRDWDRAFARGVAGIVRLRGVRADTALNVNSSSTGISPGWLLAAFAFC